MAKRVKRKKVLTPETQALAEENLELIAYGMTMIRRCRLEISTDEAESMVGETLTLAAESWSPDGGASFKTYFINGMKMAIRNRRTRRHSQQAKWERANVRLECDLAQQNGEQVRDGILANQGDYRTPEAVDSESSAVVRAAIAKLPESHRDAVEGYYLRGLTLTEVGAELGITREAVRQRLHKAKRELASLLCVRDDGSVVCLEGPDDDEDFAMTVRKAMLFGPMGWNRILRLGVNPKICSRVLRNYHGWFVRVPHPTKKGKFLYELTEAGRRGEKGHAHDHDSGLASDAA